MYPAIILVAERPINTFIRCQFFSQSGLLVFLRSRLLVHRVILYVTLFVGKDLMLLIISLLSSSFALSFIEPASQLALSLVPSLVFFGLLF